MSICFRCTSLFSTKEGFSVIDDDDDDDDDDGIAVADRFELVLEISDRESFGGKWISSEEEEKLPP